MKRQDRTQPDTIPKRRADTKLEFGDFLAMVWVAGRLANLTAGPSSPPPSETTTSPTRTLEPETVTKSALSRPWNVVVWNDPITLMNYVVYVFQKLFGFSRERATQLMLEVHEKGRTIVATVDREKAEFYVSRLHGFGLQASLEQTE